MNQIPAGYLKVHQRLSAAEAERLKRAWESYFTGVAHGAHSVLVLDQGIEFVPFAGQAVPDAFCLHCGIANLKSSIWCEGCGAPLLRQ